MKRIIFGVLLLFCTCAASAQLSFVQFIVVGLENEQQCRDIEAYIQSQSTIESVRVESHNDNFLAFFDPTLGYTESHFHLWLEALGFDFYCFKKGTSGQTPVVKLTRAGCIDAIEKK
ncbi:MAG: hypothetical protein ACKVOR_13845 [Flavobacteriales bacterium]